MFARSRYSSLGFVSLSILIHSNGHDIGRKGRVLNYFIVSRCYQSFIWGPSSSSVEITCSPLTFHANPAIINKSGCPQCYKIARIKSDRIPDFVALVFFFCVATFFAYFFRSPKQKFLWLDFCPKYLIDHCSSTIVLFVGH